ncbi:MAG: PTS sugar transporter subunit IIC [Campylobacter sp.]|nr:PTS sugar transporter subunit IIC [Campylobacter sp.]
MQKTDNNLFKRTINYIVISMNGMAYGLFSTLIIATIIATLAGFLPKNSDIYTFLINISTVLKQLMGVGIGIGIAWAFKIDGLKLIAAGVAGGIASYMAGTLGFKIGDPLTVYFVVIITIELVKFILRNKTPIDIIIIPLLSILIAGVITVLLYAPVSSLTTAVGKYIEVATDYQPFLMGIVIAVIMGMALTAPISSAAIAIAIGLDGIAGGAAVVGCSVQIIGFAIMIRKDNNIGTIISVAIGTSMLQFKNIVKKPIIWLPTIIVSAILGPIATMVLKTQTSPIGAGMGTSGLVGQIDTYNTMGNSSQMWLSILVLQILLPIILVYVVDVLFRKFNFIKDGDLKI